LIKQERRTMARRRLQRFIVLVAALLMSLRGIVVAQTQSTLPFDINARSAVLMNAHSGAILYEKNPDERLIPASLTKILTLYLAFDALKAGQVKLTDEVTVSENAWKMGGSQMFIEVGQRVKFEDLIKGITIVSGNDACIAVAEAVSGSVPVFVKNMNNKAKTLGLVNSQFLNPHGLPAEGHYSSARDMAILGLHYVKDHPEALKYHSLKEFTYGNIIQQNRNRLLFKDSSVDGLKTGWTEDAGFHLAATAQRDNDRFITVVMGTKKEREREEDALALLTYGFKNFSTTRFCGRGEKAGEIKVWKGQKGIVSVEPAEDGFITLPKGKEKTLSISKQIPESIFAPVAKAQKLGTLILTLDGKKVQEVALVASEEVPAGGILKRMLHSFILFFFYPPYIGSIALFVIFLIITITLVSGKKKKEFHKLK
jgi:D-alanyl-D-alanine carboxypeptidase (penicillin-binding protein 5/6)